MMGLNRVQIRVLSCVIAECATILSVQVARGDESTARPIRIVSPRVLAGDEIAAVRVPLGIPNDYKPFLAQLKRGNC